MNTFVLRLLPALALLTAAQAQENWPRFLGAGGTGHGPADAPLAAVDPKEAGWKKDLPGTGVSSPVVWGNRIFLTSEISETPGQRAVLCYDATTGAELWRFADTFAGHGKHKFNSFASSTPAVDADRLYISWTSGGDMHVLSLTLDGTRAWQKNLGPYSEEHGSGASPVLSGGTLIIVKDSVGVPEADSFIAGLDPATGETRWKLPRQSHRTPFSTPLTTEQAGEPCVVLSSNPAALTCVRSRDGHVLWQEDNMIPQLRPVGSPGYADGVFFGTVGQGGTAKGSTAVRIENGKATRIWEGKKGMPYVPSIVPQGKNFLMLSDGGILSAIKAADGTQLWSERLFQDQAYSTPIVSGEYVYCIGRSGIITTVQTSDTGCKILSTAQLGDPCDSTPAFANGHLIIRTSRQLLSMGTRKVIP